MGKKKKRGKGPKPNKKKPLTEEEKAEERKLELETEVLLDTVAELLKDKGDVIKAHLDRMEEEKDFEQLKNEVEVERSANNQEVNEPIEPPKLSLKFFVIPIGMLVWNNLGIEIVEGTHEMYILRCVFLGVILLSLLVAFYFYVCIRKFGDTAEGKIMIWTNERTYPGRFERVRVSQADHDLTELYTFIRQSCVATIMSYFIHWQWEAVQPLVAQCMMQPFNIMYNKLFDIYVLGRKMKRPFNKEKNILENFFKPPEESHQKLKEINAKAEEKRLRKQNEKHKKKYLKNKVD